MGPIMSTIAGSFNVTNHIMNLVLSDLSNDDAVTRTRDGEGSSISWIVGHLLYYRSQIMGMLGGPTNNPWTESFGNTSATDGSDYPDVSEMLSSWNELSSALDATVAGVTDAQLLVPIASDNGSPHGEKKVLDTITFFMWHESYHMGALGMIRTQLGYPATATLAMEAASKSASG